MSTCVVEIGDDGFTCDAMKPHSNVINGRNNESTMRNNFNFLNSIRIRYLNGADIPTLQELCKDWFPIKYPSIWYESITYDEKYSSIAATLNGKIIAILVAEVKPRRQLPKEDADLLAAIHPGDTKVAYILSLGVCREHRRKGVASYILQNFLLETTTSNSPHEVKAVYLHVLCTNVTAIRFYERHNFQLLHYLPAYYIINSEPKDGYSYVLYINGGRPTKTCGDCLCVISTLIQNVHCCEFTRFLFTTFNSLLTKYINWPKLPSLASRQRQCHTL